jgi:hypothetical protein
MSFASNSEPLPLSVVVATGESWPAIRTCLYSLLPQVERAGGELIVADGAGDGLPEDDESYFRRCKWIRRPGLSVFELRAIAIGEARGDVIALTEDHCVPAHDWIEVIQAAHVVNPAAKVIGGPVFNGSPDRLGDWANHLMNFSGYVPPIRPGGRWPPIANISFKRDVFPDSLEPGWLENELPLQLESDETVATDERMAVTHIQTRPFTGHVAAHFHNGRSTSLNGFDSRSQPDPRSWIRRPVWMVKASLDLTGGSAHRQALRCLPLTVALAAAHSLGELVGKIAGPGDSPNRLP